MEKPEKVTPPSKFPKESSHRISPSLSEISNPPLEVFRCSTPKESHTPSPEVKRYIGYSQEKPEKPAVRQINFQPTIKSDPVRNKRNYRRNQHKRSPGDRKIKKKHRRKERKRHPHKELSPNVTRTFSTDSDPDDAQFATYPSDTSQSIERGFGRHGHTRRKSRNASSPGWAHPYQDIHSAAYNQYYMGSPYSETVTVGGMYYNNMMQPYMGFGNEMHDHVKHASFSPSYYDPAMEYVQPREVRRRKGRSRKDRRKKIRSGHRPRRHERNDRHRPHSHTVHQMHHHLHGRKRDPNLGGSYMPEDDLYIPGYYNLHPRTPERKVRKHRKYTAPMQTRERVNSENTYSRRYYPGGLYDEAYRPRRNRCYAEFYE